MVFFVEEVKHFRKAVSAFIVNINLSAVIEESIKVKGCSLFFFFFGSLKVLVSPKLMRLGSNVKETLSRTLLHLLNLLFTKSAAVRDL